MSPSEIEKFERFLEDSFREGMYSRELRLSNEELEYIKKKYPRAILKRCETRAISEEKAWWEINLLNTTDNLKEAKNFSTCVANEKESAVKARA